MRRIFFNYLIGARGIVRRFSIQTEEQILIVLLRTKWFLFHPFS